mmetsp:Transcript_65762/g.154790  ORF Transcript_65762/g.154790 Transcript_65762/m.154790 type:complete len:250 (+) Transcript_65762:20-769(+)
MQRTIAAGVLWTKFHCRSPKLSKSLAVSQAFCVGEAYPVCSSTSELKRFVRSNTTFSFCGSCTNSVKTWLDASCACRKPMRLCCWLRSSNGRRPSASCSMLSRCAPDSSSAPRRSWHRTRRSRSRHRRARSAAKIRSVAPRLAGAKSSIVLLSISALSPAPRAATKVSVCLPEGFSLQPVRADATGKEACGGAGTWLLAARRCRKSTANCATKCAIRAVSASSGTSSEVPSPCFTVGRITLQLAPPVSL